MVLIMQIAVLRHLTKQVILCSCFIFAVSTSSISYAENLRVGLQNVIRNAIAFGVDEKSHSQFWDNLTASEKREIKDGMSFLLETGQRWQYAFWESASKTASAREIIRTENYQSSYKSLENLGGFQVNLNKAEAALEDIANGNAIELPPDIISMMQIQSNKIVIDEQIANFIRDNVGVAIDRLRILFSEQWPPKQETYLYPDQELKYFSSVRLAFIPTDYGIRGLSSWEAIKSIGTDNTLEIVVLDYSRTVGINFGHDTMLQGFQQLGIEHRSFGNGIWLGLPFEESTVKFQLGDKDIYALSRTVVDKKNQRTYNFTVNSYNNTLEAIDRMQQFLLNVSLIY